MLRDFNNIRKPMKSTHNTARAYGKGAIAMLCMATGTAVLMAACSTVKPPAKEFSQDRLAESIRVPAGHVVVLETTAVGVLNYECRRNPASTGPASWTLASPKADLIDRTGKTVGNYSGPPALWTHMDGSTVVGSQLAVSPALGATNLSNQLSKGVAGKNVGAMQDVAYSQRINTKGGLDFSKACGEADVGDKTALPYQADYIFWKPV